MPLCWHSEKVSTGAQEQTEEEFKITLQTRLLFFLFLSVLLSKFATQTTVWFASSQIDVVKDSPIEQLSREL